MRGKKAPKKATVKKTKKAGSFTADERAAMQERARELKADSRRGKGTGKNADGENDLLEKIAAMQGPDQTMARRLHAIMKANAPGLEPKTWYGMPAYAKDGKVVCFFQGAQKCKSRYATLGFSDQAQLDDGAMWPASFALKKLTGVEEAQIIELVRRAIGS